MEPSNNSLLSRLQTAIGQHLAERRVTAAMLQTPEPGVCFAVPLPDPLPLRWAVTHCHPDRPDCFYIVPADPFLRVGTPDVLVDEPGSDRFVLRCGEGFWIEGRHLPPENGVGTLPPEALRTARRVLAALARGKMPADPSREETDWDPEYEEWLETVAACRERWRAELEEVPVKPVRPAARTELALPVLPLTESVLVLAAAPGSPLLRDLDAALASMTASGGPRLQAAAVADESLWITNPVLCLRFLSGRITSDDPPSLLRRLQSVLARHGIFTRPDLAGTTAPEREPVEVDVEPGVVGLAADPWQGIGLVVPLRVRPALRWDVAATLPFSANDVQDLLPALLRASDLPREDAIPERFSFTIDSPFRLRADGPSMHIAALLAVLESLTDSECLRRACALVELEGTSDLRAVDGTSLKLGAFLREYGRGTLLVVAENFDVPAEAINRFERVWRVASLADLARLARAEGLLEPLVGGSFLSRGEFKLVQDRLQGLKRALRYQEALDLVQRVQHDNRLPRELAETVRRDLVRLEAELCRHLGDSDRAEQLARSVYERICDEKERASYDEQALAAAEHAAAFYDRHRFAELAALLGPWREQIDQDPRRFLAETRVRIFNTLGRALVILGRPGWEDLFRHSIRLLRLRDPYDLGRSYGYLVHGLLRHGQVEQARTVLNEAYPRPMEPLSRRLLLASEAELARQAGRQWMDPEMEAGPPTGTPGYPFALYLQATARQPGRSDADRLQRFRRANELLQRDIAGGGGTILEILAGSLELAAAAVERSGEAWQTARGNLARYLEPTTGTPFAEYYREVWTAITGLSQPDESQATGLLGRFPYT